LKKIPSVTFGEVEVDETEIYTFPEQIPGLRGLTEYVVIDRPELAPFKWLQACQPNYLSLMMLSPKLIDPAYSVRLNEDNRKIIGDFEDGDVEVMALVVVPEDPKQMTANLLAPILLNKKTRKGMQTVVEGHHNLLRVKVIKG